ncbi:MAG TPA: cytochrome c [Steroidobacteraceae bacterium]|jgi:mono/diheme cytochrome c family protein|nr:cytochrome c [Steroidobacteraceae bacterium]
MRAAVAISLALTLAAMSSCTTMSAYSVRPQEYSGVRLYQVFCSSCHGLTGHGDGPLQPLLKSGVPDLTQLSQRNGGKFPAEQVRQIIDGRTVVAAHGSREMPVWGFEFYGDVANDELARKQADETIQRLVDYLRSIQPDYYR